MPYIGYAKLDKIYIYNKETSCALIRSGRTFFRCYASSNEIFRCEPSEFIAACADTTFVPTRECFTIVLNLIRR